MVNKEKFRLALGETHVVEAIGWVLILRQLLLSNTAYRKPSDTSNHFRVTIPEPYGVCCLEGLKVSMGMHQFGERRWRAGIVDDIRSTIFQDQNTRIIGDFTKMVRIGPSVQFMYNTMLNDSDWVHHFNKVVDDSSFPSLAGVDPVIPKIISACEWLATSSSNFHRKTLQTRFFEGKVVGICCGL